MISNPKFEPTGDHILGPPKPVSVEMITKDESMRRTYAASIEAVRRSLNLETELGDLREARVKNELENRVLKVDLDQARMDELTELPTRRIFNERLGSAIERADRDGSTFAVLAADVRHLTLYNNRGEKGHGSGDDYLIGAARGLEAAVRPSDTIARVGGDEFYGILFDIDTGGTDPEEFALKLAAEEERVVAAKLKENPELRRSQFPAHVNIGVALYQPGDTAESIVKRADLAERVARTNYYDAMDPQTRVFLAGMGDKGAQEMISQVQQQPQDAPPSAA